MQKNNQELTEVGIFRPALTTKKTLFGGLRWSQLENERDLSSWKTKSSLEIQTKVS